MTEEQGGRTPITRVVCTAGHVDHGKSALVAALTGTDPDRLAEEKRRGLTIDLGFAWTTLPGGDVISFVDLPGHERFVPTMLAGAGPVSQALLVVAADEGWMPQSEEHLAILDLLDVRHAVVALNRVDLVDDETAEIAQALLEDRLADSLLAGAPIVQTSIVDGRGIEKLRLALARMLRASPPPVDLGQPRLWIDRAFSVAGAGTVVTGTLTGGRLRRGDALVLQPAGTPVRVRGLQSLERQVETAEPGWRVAVNLAGAEVAACGRGTALTAPDVVGLTGEVEAWARPLPGVRLRRRGAWQLHAGTVAVEVGVAPVAGGELTVEGPVRLTLRRPLPLTAGDRVILRDAGRGATAAGATVIDPDPPPRPRGQDARHHRADVLRVRATATTPAERLLGLLADRGPLPLGEALSRSGAGQDLPAETASRVILRGGIVMTTEDDRQLSDLAVAAVARVHQRRPALAAADTSVPRTLLLQAGHDEATVAAVIDGMVAGGRLERVPGGVRLPGHEPRLTQAQQQARSVLLETLEAAGVAAPPLREVAADVADRLGLGDQERDDLVLALERDGQLVRLGEGATAVTAGVLDRAIATLASLPEPFSAAEARDALATTRKHALPLLEHLDASGRTRRHPDDRRTVRT